MNNGRGLMDSSLYVLSTHITLESIKKAFILPRWDCSIGDRYWLWARLAGYGLRYGIGRFQPQASRSLKEVLAGTAAHRRLGDLFDASESRNHAAFSPSPGRPGDECAGSSDSIAAC
jgi:hypothetical protein